MGKAAQTALPFIVSCARYDYVPADELLKPALRMTVLPLLKVAAASAPERPTKPPAVSTPIKAAPLRTATPPLEISVTAAPASVAPPSKLAGVRRKPPQGSIPRPDSRASIATSDDVAALTSKLPSKLGTSGLKRPTSAFTSKPATSAPSPGPSVSSPFATVRLYAERARLA